MRSILKITKQKTANMKKLILSAAVIIAAIGANAQNKIGLQAGGAFSTYNVEFGNTEEKSDSKFGFLVGAVADVDFGNSVSFRPELNFIQKGGELKSTSNFTGGNVKSQDETTLSYIQLSPNFVYNFPAGTGKFFIGVGPELALGIGGKYKSETVTTVGNTVTTSNDKADVRFDGKKNANDADLHLKRIDLGANAIAGYTLSNGAFISAGYTAGLKNISPEDNTSFKNSGFNVKIGFLFGGAKK